MKRTILAIALFSSANAFAAGSNAGCLMCDFPIPAEATLAPKSDVCDDLGYAVCTSEQGGAQYSKMMKQLNAEMKAIVDSALDKAAVSFGAANRNAFFLKELGKTLRLRQDLTSNAITYLVSGTGFVGAGDISAAFAECSARQMEMNKYSVYGDQDAESIRAHITQLENMMKLNRLNQIELYSIDITGFLRELSQKCQELASEQAIAGYKLPVDTNASAQSLALACRDTNGLRQKVLRVYRMQKNLNSSAELRALVASLIDAVAFDVHGFARPQPGSTGPDVLMKLRERYSGLLRAKFATCNNFNIDLDDERESASKKIARSRVFIETMIDRIYTPERRAKIERYFSEVKSEVKKVAARVVTDPLKLRQIYDRYDLLKLTWLSKPEARFYEKDPETGAELLSPDIEFTDFGLNRAFLKGGVSFFTALNAFYMVPLKQGVIDVPTSVTIMPMFFMFGDHNPFTLVSVLAHEVGHQIGPMLSAVNGFDLRTDYRPLLQCLAKPDSIGMQDHQSDESIADYISAEVIANMVNQLPEQKRRRAGTAAVGGYCSFNAAAFGSISIRTEGVHPESMLRISGIYGGNSNFRKAIGCSAPSPSYHTCDLDHTN